MTTQDNESAALAQSLATYDAELSQLNRTKETAETAVQLKTLNGLKHMLDAINSGSMRVRDATKFVARFLPDIDVAKYGTTVMFRTSEGVGGSVSHPPEHPGTADLIYFGVNESLIEITVDPKASEPVTAQTLERMYKGDPGLPLRIPAEQVKWLLEQIELRAEPIE